MAWFKREKKSIEQTTPPDERRALIEYSHKPAAAFFDTLEKEFIPALEKQDKAPRRAAR